jgi:nucleotide-binding universal stress UspA family protein
MKAVLVGVDPGASYRPALGLVKALKLSSEKTVLACALEPLLPDGETPLLSRTHPLAELMEHQSQQATSELNEARNLAGTLPNPIQHRQAGTPIHVLISAAKAYDADLIAVGSTGKGWLEGLFWGSVTRGLTVEGPCSLLVGKHAIDTQEPLTVIAGFDGSDKSRKCLLKLAEWKPKGIGRLVIAGALETPHYEALGDEMTIGEPVSFEQLKENWLESASRLARDLSDVAEKVEVIIHEGEPVEILNSLMGDLDGDLLVLGEGGHGFVERLLLGSVSMHFIVKETHNVLALRS